MNEIALSVDALKKILERLPPTYSVSIQVNNMVMSAHTFDISEDYEEIVLKWFEEQVSEKYKVCKEYSEYDDRELSRKWSN